ncbi:Transcription factor CBF/NF-Y/archaeal histone domain - like 10 [Theobroma cacao]|nr:Transcription factor CBF/NF-Y/archaeal histone domain - like 10 [Theobroma cacao]
MEPMDIVGKSKEDASLPKATMTKIIKEMLPPDVRVARDAQDLLIECCVEFINLISSESNDVCNREEKRTIAPEHVLKALEVPLYRLLSNMKCLRKIYFFCHIKQCLCWPSLLFKDMALNSSTYFFFLGTLWSNRGSSKKKFCNPPLMIELVLGFGEYIEEVYAAYEQHKIETMDSLKGGKWSNGAEMTEEEAVAEQQRMFAEARARMNGGAVAPKQPDPDPSLES